MPALLSGCLATSGSLATGSVIRSNPPSAPTQITPSTPVSPSGYAKLPAPVGTLPYFANLKHGDLVSSPLGIQVGLLRMGMAPAGTDSASAWQLYLLVNVASVDVNAPMPSDANHLPLGVNQTEATLELAPGAHTLQLLLADQNNVPHHPAVMSERITVLVK